MACMPFYVAVYDFNEKRVQRALKLFRQYMTWVQNSVFEGELTEAQFEELRQEAERLVNDEEDSIIFYRIGSEKFVTRKTLGEEPGEPGRML